MVTPTPYFTKSGIGKLFADPKPTDEHRYPRGYTPERMAEVRGAGGVFDYRQAADNALGRNSPSGKMGREADPQVPTHSVRKTQEVIARSTTPLSELRTARVFVDSSEPKRLYPNSAPAAFYREGYPRQEGGETLATGRIHIAPRPAFVPTPERDPGRNKEDELQYRMNDESTIIHELGHHRSNLEGHTKERDEYGVDKYKRGPEFSGQEEARADDNMVERYRPHPLDLKRSRATKGFVKPHEELHSYEEDNPDWHRKNAFAIYYPDDPEKQKQAEDAYDAARTTPLIRDRRDKAGKKNSAEWDAKRNNVQMIHRDWDEHADTSEEVPGTYRETLQESAKPSPRWQGAW